MEKKQQNSQQDEKKVKKQPVKKQKQTEEKPVEKKSAVKTKQEVKTTEEKTKPEVKTEKSQPTKSEMPKKKKSGLFKAAMATFAVAAAVALSIFGITELTKVSPEKAVSEITQNGEIRYGKVNELVLSFDKNVSFDKDGDVVWILDGSEVQRGSVKNGDSFALKHELGSVGLHDVRVEVCDYQNLTAEKRVEVLKPLLTVKASDAVKIYGQKNPGVKYSVSGFVDGDGMDAVSQTVNPVFDADETSGVGEYCIKKDFSDEKYDVTVEGGKLTVLPRPVAAKADAVSKVYDGTADAGSVNLRAEGLINGDVVTLTYATASFADKNVGQKKQITFSQLKLTGEAAKNYSLLNNVKAEGEIVPKTIRLKDVKVNDKVCDGNTNVTFSSLGIFDGIEENDDVQIADIKAHFEDENVGTNKNVIVDSCLLKGKDAQNYRLSMPDGLVANIN